MAATLQTCRDTFFSILNEDESSTNYPVAYADQLLNNAQKLVCSGGVVNLSNMEQVKRGPLPFLQSYAFFTSVTDQTLTVAAIAGGTTLTVGSTSGFATAGKLWINNNAITYTGITATQFTGCSNILFAHQAGKRIGQLFALPADYMTPTRVIYDGYFELPFKDYRNIWTDLKNFSGGNVTGYNQQLNDVRYGLMQNPFYTIVTGTGLLPFQLNENGKAIVLEYDRKPSIMTASTDPVTIPDDDFVPIIAYVAVAEMLYNRGEQDQGLLINNTLAIPRLHAMYNFYTGINGQQPFNTRIQTAKDNIGLNI